MQRKVLDSESGSLHLVVPLETRPGKKALETGGEPLELFPA